MLPVRQYKSLRESDLSNRPWENGWAAPASPFDAIESHPYLFTRYFKNLPAREGYLKELMALPRTPDNGPNERSPHPEGLLYPNPVIINEYGWIWLNRDGSTTTLTDLIYERLFPWADTPRKRLEIYAKTLGIKTEYWRAHRKAAAVMHFCGLGYSRSETPRGQTSDNFIDIQNLVFEPHFYKHVRPSFSPLGIMLDFWDTELPGGQNIQIPAHIFNDTYESISDTLRVDLYMNDMPVSTQTALYFVNENGKTIIESSLSVPNISGRGKIEGTIKHRGETIKSIREFTIR
jgi:beta-galactosidase